MSQELERRLDQLGVDSKTFQELEEEFQKVIQELSGDASMERFRREFEKLYKALKDSHEREKELLKNSRRLNDSLIQEAVGVESAIKITQEDDNKIRKYQAELENSQRIMRGLKEHEEKNEVKIQELTNTMKKLEDQLKSSTTMTTGRSNEINDLTSRRDEFRAKKLELEEERRRLDGETKELEQQIEKEAARHKQTKDELDAVRKKVTENTVATNENEIKKTRQLEEIEQKKKDKQQALNDRDEADALRHSIIQNLEKLEKLLQQNSHSLQQTEAQIQRQDKDELELKRKENDQIALNTTLLDQASEKRLEHDKLRKAREKLTRELQQEEQELALKDEELVHVTEKKDEYEKRRNELKVTVYDLEREIDAHNKIVKEDNKLVNELTREQNGIKDNLTKARKINEEQYNEKQKVMKEKQKLSRDNAMVKKEISQLERKISVLKVENENKADEATQANSKYDHLLEEIKLKDNMISELQKKNLETEAKLKQQQSLYEAVRSDRNIYSKNLTETQEEIAEIKRKYRIIMHQISQLKEEISAKDIMLNNEYHNANDLKKNWQSLHKQNETIKEGMDKQEKNIRDFNEEIAKLQFIIKESETQLTKLKEQYEMIVSERDILGTQLIRRNEELGLLYEKIKIQQSTLAKGEHQYKDKLTHIEVLKETMRDLMRKLKQFKRKVQEIPDLKKNVHTLHKELIEERLKVKALSEELENPMNVHRWRKLEGMESETRLIAKTDDVRKKEGYIGLQEKAIDDMRNAMKRQPGISEADMIVQYKDTIKEKDKQLKVVEMELGAHQTRATQKRFQVDTLNRQLRDLKAKLFDKKRKEQQIKLIKSKEQDKWKRSIHLPEKRFVGGGFNLIS